MNCFRNLGQILALCLGCGVLLHGQGSVTIYGTVTDPPLYDPERRIALAYDSGNAVIGAWRLPEEGGLLQPLWRRPCATAPPRISWRQSAASRPTGRPIPAQPSRSPRSASCKAS